MGREGGGWLVVVVVPPPEWIIIICLPTGGGQGVRRRETMPTEMIKYKSVGRLWRTKTICNYPRTTFVLCVCRECGELSLNTNSVKPLHARQTLVVCCTIIYWVNAKMMEPMEWPPTLTRLSLRGCFWFIIFKWRAAEQIVRFHVLYWHGIYVSDFDCESLFEKIGSSPRWRWVKGASGHKINLILLFFYSSCKLPRNQWMVLPYLFWYCLCYCLSRSRINSPNKPIQFHLIDCLPGIQFSFRSSSCFCWYFNNIAALGIAIFNSLSSGPDLVEEEVFITDLLMCYCRLRNGRIMALATTSQAGFWQSLIRISFWGREWLVKT